MQIMAMKMENITFFTCASEPIRCDDYSYDCKAILLAGNGDNW